MEGIENGVLLKSEKIPQKKKILILWIIVGLLFAAYLIYFIVDYCNYKKEQKFGLTIMSAVSEIAESKSVNKVDSYEEQCHDAYHLFDIDTDSYFFNNHGELSESFSSLMEKAGYDRYWSERDVKFWFKYTDPFEFFIGSYGNPWNVWHNLSNEINYGINYGLDWHRYSPFCLYAIILFSLIFTISVNKEAKKEIVVYDDSVVCKTNRKKSKQLLFEDISNVDFGKNSLKLIGTGVKFKISNITNAEEIKTFIIGRKKDSQNTKDVSQPPAASGADELKKYKELFDSGVISQEEFDAKKKQLLGL